MDNPISNPLKLKGKGEYMDTYDSIIDTTFYQSSNGDAYYSMLYVDYLDAAKTNQQYVIFGEGDNDHPFPFDFDHKF